MKGSRDQAKFIVTLSMIWIGIMAVIQTPEWLRAARDFVVTSTGGKKPADPAPTSSGGGSGANIAE